MNFKASRLMKLIICQLNGLIISIDKINVLIINNFDNDISQNLTR